MRPYYGKEKDKTAHGKTPEGSIRLTITEKNNHIHIKISDDSKGLDFQKIREKALDLKLLDEKDAGKKSNLLKAFFSPGFSTAESSDVHEMEKMSA